MLVTDIMSKEQTAGASGALYHGGASRSGGHVREPKNWVACCLGNERQWQQVHAVGWPWDDDDDGDDDDDDDEARQRAARRTEGEIWERSGVTNWFNSGLGKT
ncbi:hypothetical protein Ac2012v2_004289 [Leucoagaricus gongylophorus]